MINKTEKKVTVIIPSKTYDVNLKHCIKKIRLFYKKIKIILVLDEKKAFIKDKNIKIISSGSKTSTAINNGTFAQLTAITGDNRWKFWSHLVTRVFSQP